MSLSVKTIENVQGGFRHDLITLPLLPSELEEREQKAIEKQIEKQKTAVQEEEKDEEPTKDNEKESDNGDLEDYLYRTFFKEEELDRVKEAQERRLFDDLL